MNFSTIRDAGAYLMEMLDADDRDREMCEDAIREAMRESDVTRYEDITRAVLDRAHEIANATGPATEDDDDQDDDGEMVEVPTALLRHLRDQWEEGDIAEPVRHLLAYLEDAEEAAE
jgi:hypothetical protein